MPLGVPFFLAFLAAGLLCFAVGWGLGYPALRVQHHYLAFVTLAFTTLVFLVLRNEQWLTNGIYGITGTPRPTILGWSTNSARDFYFFCLGILALLSLATWWMLRSPWGRAFVALRENPLRALSLGLDTRRYTLMAFAIGSSLGGLSWRAVCAAGAIHRAELVRARTVVQPTADGDRRRQRQFLRALRRRAGRCAAAGMAAHHARLLPHPLCRRDHGDDGVLSLGSARDLPSGQPRPSAAGEQGATTTVRTEGAGS
jgi:hypothetical protein